MLTKNQNLKFRIKTSTFYFLFSKFYFIVLFSTFYFLFSGNIKAAQFSIISDAVDIRPGDAVVVTVLLDTQGKNINAMDGKILFPGDILEIKEIRDGNSVVNLWVEKPHLAGQGEIYFSGIVSGGYSGGSGKLFSVEFRARRSGGGNVKISEERAFLNDGLATPDAAIAFADLALRVSTEFPTAENKAITDREPPESFIPEVASNPDVFDGKYFLVFATVDKGIGVDYYEVMEVSRRDGADLESWQRAESPYLLEDQNLTSDVYVRAVDVAGNFIVGKISPRFPGDSRSRFALAAIDALAILIVLLLIIWRAKKRAG